MTDPNLPSDEPKVFDADYVRELRQENANWRTKFRNLETKINGIDIAGELAKSGISADPKWVEMRDGQTAADAVAEFKTKYPHLVIKHDADPGDAAGSSIPPEGAPAAPVAAVKTPGIPKAVTPKASAKAPTGERTLSEIKADPVARAELRELYRQKLAE